MWQCPHELTENSVIKVQLHPAWNPELAPVDQVFSNSWQLSTHLDGNLSHSVRL